jgi:hypothetical protein
MSEQDEVNRLKQLLAEARSKHAAARHEVESLKSRVGPTSFRLADAKNVRSHCRAEVIRLTGLLKQHGLSDKEIVTVKAAVPESATIT